MNDVAILVEGLSKRYRIGQRKGYLTLRESLARSWRSALSLFRNRVQTGPKNANNYIWALRDVSFEIKKGEIVGIIGRNGAGKTTLLKILSRITEPTKGCAEIYGRVGSLLEVGTGFHPELTGRENISLNGAILGMKKAEIERKFDEIVAFAEIEKFIDTPVKRYSSGMYVRLAFAVAAHLEPEILMVDEVLAVGDAAFQKKCLEKMGDVVREGRTIVLVSHNMSSILQLSSQAIWLESGEIAEQGDARTVISHYLRDNRIPLGEAVFDPTEGSHGVGLVRVYVMDDKQHIRPDIPYKKPFYIAIEYQVEFSIDGLRVGFKLYNERNQAVLHSATSDCPSLDAKVSTPGWHRARAQIPGAWLAPGRYYVELGIWSPKVGHHQHLLSALAFDITEASAGNVGEEILRPLLEWSVAWG